MGQVKNASIHRLDSVSECLFPIDALFSRLFFLRRRWIGGIRDRQFKQFTARRLSECHRDRDRLSRLVRTGVLRSRTFFERGLVNCKRIEEIRIDGIWAVIAAVNFKGANELAVNLVEHERQFESRVDS